MTENINTDKYKYFLENISSLHKTTNSISNLCKLIGVPKYLYNIITNKKTEKIISKELELKQHIDARGLNEYIISKSIPLLKFIIKNPDPFALGSSKETVYSWISKMLMLNEHTFRKTLNDIKDEYLEAINENNFSKLNWLSDINLLGISEEKNTTISNEIANILLTIKIEDNFLTRLSYHTGERSFLSKPYALFFNKFEDYINMDNAVHNISTLIAASVADPSQNGEQQLANAITGNIKYNEIFKFLCLQTPITNNRVNDNTFGFSLISKLIELNLTNKDSLPISEIINIFGVDNLSNYDKKQIIDSFLYKDQIEVNTATELIKEFFTPQNEEELTELLNGAILYRNNSNGRKFESILKTFLPNLPIQNAKEIIESSRDENTFTVNYEQQAKQLIKANITFTLKNELNSIEGLSIKRKNKI